jgi:hypothetical protein
LFDPETIPSPRPGAQFAAARPGVTNKLAADRRRIHANQTRRRSRQSGIAKSQPTEKDSNLDEIPQYEVKIKAAGAADGPAT